jgi:hypothetical protein
LVTSPTVFVTLTASGLQIEEQVFHVEPQLAQGILHEVQNPAAAARAVGHSVQKGLDDFTVLRREPFEGCGQVDQILREFFGGLIGDSGCLRHGWRLQVMRV